MPFDELWELPIEELEVKRDEYVVKWNNYVEGVEFACEMIKGGTK